VLHARLRLFRSTDDLRNVLLAVLVAVTLAPLARADEPRFLIESFSVSGTGYVSPRILIAESRLDEGREYSEAELAAAMGRIERLPFVLFA